MAKPTVPTGPIPIEGQSPAIRLGSLRNQLRTLSDDPLLDQIQVAIDSEDWRTAVGLLAIVTESIGAASTTAVKLINRINRKRYNPLLEGSNDG